MNAPLPRRGLTRLASRRGEDRWRALRASFRAAWDGVVETSLRQRNMRIHLVAGLLVALVGSCAAMGVAEQLALILSVSLVLAAELANSSVEALVDLVTREHHEQARIAKDAGAGAVLVLALGSVLVLILVLVHAWPAIVAGRRFVLEQTLFGLPLAGDMALLLTPFRRPQALDKALALAGVVLLGALAKFSLNWLFTALAALLFGVAVAVAARRHRLGAS